MVFDGILEGGGPLSRGDPKAPSHTHKVSPISENWEMCLQNGHPLVVFAKFGPIGVKKTLWTLSPNHFLQILFQKAQPENPKKRRFQVGYGPSI